MMALEKITQVSKIRPLENMNVCIEFHGNPLKLFLRYFNLKQSGGLTDQHHHPIT